MLFEVIEGNKNSKDSGYFTISSNHFNIQGADGSMNFI